MTIYMACIHGTCANAHTHANINNCIQIYTYVYTYIYKCYTYAHIRMHGVRATTNSQNIQILIQFGVHS